LYRAALEERTGDRFPLEWAGSTADQGIVLMLLADRLAEPTRARTATQQIEAALATMRDNGNVAAASYYEAQLLKARALSERLTSH
jgi:hypothetical protein